MKTRSDTELLAELEKELADLQTTISFLKRRMGVQANGAVAATAQGRPADTDSSDKPYLGMSILEASRKFLQRVREPKAPSEIAEALKHGGVHSRSLDFNGIVRTTLFKRGHEVGIEKFGNGRWGLQEWRPGRSRSVDTTAEPEV
jgi:hypothetical protein